MPNPKKKITFSGSLAWRISITCLLFLIIPLFVYTFILYQREIEVEEADVRSAIKGVGSEIAKRISDQITCDWQILSLQPNDLSHRMQMEQSAASPGDRFAFLKDNALLVGQWLEGEEAEVISHPLKEILTVQDPPFPIDIGFEPIKVPDQWTEDFPISNTNLTLNLGTSNERIYDLQASRIFSRIATFLLLVVFLGGGLVVFFVRQLAKPFKALCSAMQRVAEGATHTRYQPQYWGFEVNAIGNAFNEMLDEMLAHVQAAEEERIHREKLAQELKLGHEIQANLFPKHFPTNQHFTITAGCISALEVGGDFYDVFPLPSGKTLIAVADLAGKGIGACLFALGLRSSLRALATNIDSLSDIVQKANDLFLIDAEESSQFATLWIGLIENNTLSFLSLGHPPALLKRGQVLHELTTPYPAIGAMPYESIQDSRFQLEPGDELLIYSDGATEAMDKAKNLYGLNRLKEVFLHCDKTSSANDVLEHIQHFSESAVQHDDLTLLYVRFT